MFLPLGIVLVIVIAVFAVVFFILRTHRIGVRVGVCAYIASLVTTQLMMRAIASPPFNYRFPAFLATMHCLSVWVVCIGYWAYRDVSKLSPKSLDSARRYITYVVPIACTMPFSVIFSNTALIYLGAALNSIIGSFTPVSTAILSRLLGREIVPWAWVGLCIAIGGALVISWAETASAGFKTQAPEPVMIGIGFAFFAAILRSVKVVLQDMLLSPQAYDRARQPLMSDRQLEPMHVWALQSPPMMLVSLIYTWRHEGVGSAFHHLSGFGVVAMLIATCVSSTFLNILGMVAIKELGASSMQLIGKLNTLITVACSSVLFGETLETKVLCGGALMLVGIIVFERANGEAADAKQQLVQVDRSAIKKPNEIISQDLGPNDYATCNSNTEGNIKSFNAA